MFSMDKEIYFPDNETMASNNVKERLIKDIFTKDLELSFFKDEPKKKIKIPERQIIKKKKGRTEKRGRKPKEIKFAYIEKKKKTFNIFNVIRKDEKFKEFPNKPPEWL